MSRIECCLRNTVELLMSTASTVIRMRHPREENALLFHEANNTAADPITWSEGHTFVFVSKTYNPRTMAVQKFSRANVSGRSSWHDGQTMYTMQVMVYVIIVNRI